MQWRCWSPCTLVWWPDELGTGKAATKRGNMDARQYDTCLTGRQTGWQLIIEEIIVAHAIQPRNIERFMVRMREDEACATGMTTTSQ